MNNTFSIKHTVHYSEIDNVYRLRFDSIVSTFQKIALFHSAELNTDAVSLAKNSNAFWVICKTKFKINRLPEIRDEVTVTTWPTTVTPLKFNREYTIGVGDSIDIAGSSEWCTFDIDTRTIRKTETIAYPHDMVHRTDTSGAGDYSRIRDTVTENDFSHSHISRFVDVDPNGHTNNVAYARMVLDTFNPDEFAKINFKEFEIYYISQSYYGDEIHLYRKKTDYGYYVEGKTNGKTTFTCILKAD